MAAHVFRHTIQAACATCGAEWFGSGGEAVARRHAGETGHQVQLQILHRETINPVAQDGEPDYAPQVQLAPSEKRLSAEAARERVSLFEGAINQRVAR